MAVDGAGLGDRADREEATEEAREVLDRTDDAREGVRDDNRDRALDGVANTEEAREDGTEDAWLRGVSPNIANDELREVDGVDIARWRNRARLDPPGVRVA